MSAEVSPSYPQPARLLRPPNGEPPNATVTSIAWRSVGAPSPARIESQRNPPDAISAEAEQELRRRTDAARQQGFAEGEASGGQRASQRLEPALVSFGAMLNQLAQERKRIREEAEEDTVKLAIAIARRVLHRELSADPEAMLGLVKAALQKLNARETKCLRVCPQDAAAIEENRARLDLPAGLEVIPDAALRRGSAVFETSRGELDASADTQIGEIERGLVDMMRARSK